MEKFRRRIVDGPDIFPPEFWRLYLQFILTALVVYGRLVCVSWRGGGSSPQGFCDSGGRSWRKSITT